MQRNIKDGLLRGLTPARATDDQTCSVLSANYCELTLQSLLPAGITVHRMPLRMRALPARATLLRAHHTARSALWALREYDSRTRCRLPLGNRGRLRWHGMRICRRSLAQNELEVIAHDPELLLAHLTRTTHFQETLEPIHKVLR